MDDRTLLERAARAAGHKSLGRWDSYRLRCEDSNGYRYWFAPLTDDGDAFRLAVKLDIDFLPGVFDVVARHLLEKIEKAEMLDKQDKCAATRRAIVRAAAAMVSE